MLHVAAPTLSVALGSSGNELLWIIDIYSLGDGRDGAADGRPCDKIGLSACCCSAAPFWHRLAVQSRAVADGHDADCLTRFAGGGAAMIVPATLAGIRSTLYEASQRNMALGAVGSGSRRRGLRPRWWAVSCWSISTGVGVPDQCADRAGGYRD